MGTRNMTMVINKEGETKVAQYGQWDGYPSGVGLSLLSILKDNNIVEKLQENLNKVRFVEPEGRDKEFIDSYNKNSPEWSSDPDNRTEKQKRWFSSYISRDLAEEVLLNIANSEDQEILLNDRQETAKGSDSWVEWSYVVNFKENTLTVLEHLDSEPLKIYNLSNLPDEEDFIKDLEGGDEDED